MTRPSRESEYRRKLYAERHRNPESRSWLIAVRLNWSEIKALDARAQHAGVRLATMARNILTGRPEKTPASPNQHTKRGNMQARDGRRRK
jgi:putative heme degradation protein